MEELIRESMAKSEEKVQEEVMTSEEPDFSIEETIPEVVSENYKPVYENTVEELTENPIIAEELENIYNAKVNAHFVREAAEVYEQRGKLRQE